MSNAIVDAAAVTKAVTIVNTSGVVTALLTVGPMKLGSLARVSYWASNAGSDAQYSLYRGNGVSGIAILISQAQANAVIIDDSPASEYTLAYIGDQTISMTVSFSVDQLG